MTYMTFCAIVKIRITYNNKITRSSHYGLWISGSPEGIGYWFDRPHLLTWMVNREVYFLLINAMINVSNAIKKVPKPNST